jgi:hypothetical protein
VINRSYWDNQFPKNPTQTMYLRFIKSPQAKIQSAFSEAQKEYQEKKANRLRTRWTELMEKEK